MRESLLDVEALGVAYRVQGQSFQALIDVSFQLSAGETVAIVGESGSGKSTLARAILRLLPRVRGTVRFAGQDLYGLPAGELRRLRQHLQIVFQHPSASLDPRQTIGSILSEPLEVFEPDLTAEERVRRIAHVLVRVGLSPSIVDQYPHQFSGGQCQRIAIARAIVLGPRLLVCDEPLSALDVSIQAQIVNLLGELKGELGLALVFISHNLAVVRHIAQQVLVLYLGRVMERADAASLFSSPLHPYTRALLASVPLPDPRIARTLGSIPLGEPGSALHPPSGCVFQVRCAFAVERCRREVPALERAQPGRFVACHRWREIDQGA